MRRTRIARIGAGAAIALLAAGCVADMENRPKQTVGTVGGAVLGGLLGAQIGKGTTRLVAVGAGTLVGAALGNEIGASLDAADRMHAGRAAQTGLESAPTGQTTAWSNPDSGHSGSVTPTRTYQAADGGYCREFTQTVTVAGADHTGYGKACRQPDGAWQIVN